MTRPPGELVAEWMGADRTVDAIDGYVPGELLIRRRRALEGLSGLDPAALRAQAEAGVAAGLRQAATNLLAQKDGPRDAVYAVQKEASWADLRAALAQGDAGGEAR